MKKIIYILPLLFILAACGNEAADKSMGETFKNIRQPAVAGQFYPAEAERLRQDIDKYSAGVPVPGISPNKGEKIVKAILVPHAGYEYSAPVAVYAYNRIWGRETGTVVIIGNSHTAYFDGLAIDDADAWQTPLGTVPIDRELADKLIQADNSIKYNNQAHAEEHSLEVQLPFLQTVLEAGFKILPILFGNTKDKSYEKLSQALVKNLGADDIVIISTDMSHYPAYDDANEIDRATLEAVRSLDIARLEAHITEMEARGVPGEDTLVCGIDGVKTIMALANQKNWQAEILHYANSGDAAIGDKNRVVGYGAMIFTETTDTGREKAENAESVLNDEQQKDLMDIAKQTVESFVTTGVTPRFEISDPRLKWPEGAFVTLRANGELRGCIGQIIPTGDPLWEVVRNMAVAAASEDPRFNPVAEDELASLEYEVSVLSAPEKIDDWRKIELGRHGVIVRQGFHSGVFLPQVANETGWDLERFLSELCAQKAGLPPDSYKDKNTKLEVFTAQVFGDSSPEEETLVPVGAGKKMEAE